MLRHFFFNFVLEEGGFFGSHATFGYHRYESDERLEFEAGALTHVNSN